MDAAALRGLYLITPDGLDPDVLLQRVAAALRGGARLVQYRDKHRPAAARLEIARALRAVCHGHDARLLINDDVELARAVAADGVHLGQSDCPLPEARALLGRQRLIGITCHDRLELALAAAAHGADYVAFGRFFPSRSKPQATAAGITLLQQARRKLTIPLIAIGGITPDNAAPLIAAGADMLAVIDSVLGQPDPYPAAARLSELFRPISNHSSG